MIIDLTHPLTGQTPPFPGDITPEFLRSAALQTDGFTRYDVKMSMHTGTHIDMPMHMISDPRFALDFPPECFVGRGVLINAVGEPEIRVKPEYETLVRRDDIVLIRTGFDAQFGTETYFTAYPRVSIELAEFLCSRGVKLVGMDTPSPDYYPYDVHKLLLAHDILILENLTGLDRLVGVPDFEVSALPLKIAAEASAVRAVAWMR
jgi:kynurenine formamidase